MNARRRCVWLACALAAAGVAGGCSSWSPAAADPQAARLVFADARAKVTAAVAAYQQQLVGLGRQIEQAAPTSPVLGTVRQLEAAAKGTSTLLLTSAQPFAVLETLKNERNTLFEQHRDDESMDRLWTPEQPMWAGPAALLLEQAQPWLEHRSDLFARKYFHDPDDTGGNLIEGWLNSNIGLFRSVQIGDQGWQASAGVSPWEMTARLEPFARVDALDEFGVLGGLGVTFHFFPPSRGDEGLLDEWVQRIGLRAGAGYLHQDGETGDFVLGGGLQIRSITVWALWHPEEDETFIGIGASDFRWLGELTTLF